ncbi:hypothetical protein [Yoonia sp. BS5-3]|uniref:Uncharacterized protein n=1 Tax=Yoonia phaeophyticola TaxID=3137369 RepID=A0ABZ2UYX6_9RHOB
MPQTTPQTTTNNDTTRRSFAPIRRDLLERLTRECDSKADSLWQPQVNAMQDRQPRKFALR